MHEQEALKPTDETIQTPDSSTEAPHTQEPGLRLIKEKELSPEAEKILEQQFEVFLQLRIDQEATEAVKVSSTVKDGSLIHNTNFDIAALGHIFRLGVMSGEIGDEQKPLKVEQNETHYCADFFKVDEELIKEALNQESIDNLLEAYYAFARTKVQPRRPDGTLSPLKQGRSEQYLSPTPNNDSISLIFSSDSPHLSELMRYAIDGKTFHTQPNNPLSGFISRFPGENNLENAKNHMAILVGLPANFIRAIVVGGKLEASPGAIRSLHRLMHENNLDIDILNTKGQKIEVTSEEQEIDKLRNTIEQSGQLG